MNCTGKMVRVGSWKVGNFINGKIEEKSLSRGSFRTHGRVIGNKNFFLFLAWYNTISTTGNTTLFNPISYILFRLSMLASWKHLSIN